MLKNKKVIIFDLDGTLIDSVWVWNKTDEILLKEVSGNPNFEIVNIQDFRSKILTLYNDGDIYLNYCEYIKEICGSQLSALDIKSIRWQISSEFFKNIKYKPNAAEVLHKLKNLGFILVLATTGTREFINICREENINIKKEANFDDIFSYIITKDEIKESKPSPEIHLNVMNTLGVKPEECLIIEDSLMGIESAKNAGIEVASVYDKYSDSDREAINNFSDYQLNDFAQMLNLIEKELSELERD